MKRIVLLLFITSIIISSFAQNDEKEILGKYRVTQLPLEPMPKEFKTYKVEVTADNLYLRDDAYSKFVLSGFKKLDKNSTEAADMTIKVEVYPFEYKGIDVYSYTSTVKVDGVEKKITEYAYKGAIRYQFNITLIGKNDSIYYTRSDRDTKEWNNNGYKSMKEAQEFSASHVQGLPGELLGSFCSGHNNSLNEKYGFVKRTMVPLSFTVKISKKCKYDYSDLTSAHELMKSTFLIISDKEDNIVAYKEAIAPSIEKWTKALSESNIEDKKARINKDMTCALYHNIGTAYFLSKEYEKAIENFDKCIAIKSSYGDASEYKNLSKKFQERVLANMLQ